MVGRVGDEKWPGSCTGVLRTWDGDGGGTRTHEKDKGGVPLNVEELRPSESEGTLQIRHRRGMASRNGKALRRMWDMLPLEEEWTQA